MRVFSHDASRSLCDNCFVPYCDSVPVCKVPSFSFTHKYFTNSYFSDNCGKPQTLVCYLYVDEIMFMSMASTLFAGLLPPSLAYVSNPVPDSSRCRASCCSPIASASAAALDCVRFNCCSRLRPFQLLPD